ncbi:MAG: type II secretion system F family protein [Planctomycetes bacterium]|nr:type II secretion system F family protein [Planctomycetota bacterium]
MSTFAFVAKELRGARRKGRLDAESRDAALKSLKKQGLQVVELTEVRAARTLFAKRIAKSEIVYVTSQLAIMVETGINLAAALAGLAEQSDHPTLRDLLTALRKRVEGGADFSTALAEHPRHFDRTYIALIKASEQTGSLGAMLEQIANHMSGQLESRRKVLAAMAYPAVMALIAVSVTIFLLTYILPKFDPLFHREGVKLPTPTIVLLAVSGALMNYKWFWILGTIGAAIGFHRLKRTRTGQRFLDGLLIRLPIVGPMMRKVILSRAIHTLGIMVRSGVPMLDGIRLCAEVSNNCYFERTWLHVLEEITKGNRICDALRGNPLVPKTLVQMIGSGEETGKLDRVLEKVSTHFDREVDAAIKTSTSLIEPLMICVMGVVVGGIGMGLMLPIFSISRSVGH